jgi:hypothetical protein
VRRAAVQRDPALLSEHRIAMDVNAIQDEVLWNLRELRLRRAGAEHDDVARAVHVGLKLDELDPPVMSPGDRRERRRSVRGLDLGQ